MGTCRGIVGLGWHPGASSHSPEKLFYTWGGIVGCCCCYTSISRDFVLCYVPGCVCGRELQGSPGQPCVASHGTDSPSQGVKELVPALPLHRGLQQTPPEVPPSSAMCCRAPCMKARGCTETCTRPRQSQSARDGKPTEQVLPSKGRAGAAGEAGTQGQCETKSHCCWQSSLAPFTDRGVPRLWGLPISDCSPSTPPSPC